jgi:hypothetical protein
VSRLDMPPSTIRSPDESIAVPPAPRSSVAADHRSSSSIAVLTLAAVGVVYGDIGTSPLYAL